MQDRKQHLDTLAVSLLLVCCVFWGFQQILIKTTVGEVPPLPTFDGPRFPDYLEELPG